MDQWKFETTAGNALFDKGQYHIAEHHYLSACLRADTLLEPWKDPEGAVVALVVSYQNLADLYRAQGHHQQALEALQTVHARLSHALALPDLSYERQQALLRGSGQARLDIMNTVQWLGVSTQRVSQARNTKADY
ncbi:MULTISPECIES: hypothetical protein [Cobetia]|uniref:Tetratricopeptide repeat protein n=1 Tax=Cobetia crustatorum TaxID=553385 RepID=A0A558HLK3_9GAMM|nr:MULTISPECIES: hypothetical protein [Cobetia]TVU70024.1 hypothetical protein FQP86_09395 [Cobetia crustatorum]